MAILSFQRSALLFTIGSLGIAGMYVVIVSLFIMLEHLLFPIIRPLMLIFFSMVHILHFSSYGFRESIRVTLDTLHSLVPDTPPLEKTWIRA